ncbi:MAG: UDP-N-acetyl-D-mannosaminuronic acid transferase [Actinomycetota bacterium]|nr:MAG: UDP-N-acetyl-D-mannosaminuronic acid transferase [Actinomycetota bacterium]
MAVTVPAPAVRASRHILGMRVDATTYEGAAERIMAWARAGESRTVCVGTVHMVMEAHDDPGFREAVNGADLVTSDGMPLVWGLRLLGVPGATRVYGPDLTPVVCARAAAAGIPVGFHGGRPEALAGLLERVRRDHPGLRVVYAESPPFGELTPERLEREAEAIAASGARVLFVGLGCPKQERWMAAQRGRVPAVMLGVGAAFDFLAGTKRQAPRWMQRAGLEWAFRLATEPRRLWRRYLANNPRFLVLFGAQVLRERLGRGGIER